MPAIFPAHDPKYVLIVTLDEPVETSGDEPRRTAGWTAVPVAAEMIRRVAPLLGLRPEVEPGQLSWYNADQRTNPTKEHAHERQTKSLSELGLTAQGGREAADHRAGRGQPRGEDGYLFAALPGTRVHGGEFIQYALRMGAAAILTDAQGARIAAR